jgi:hypothetical protein
MEFKMSTNHYFISSPLHLLFSANLAIQNKRDKNGAVLVHNIFISGAASRGAVKE